MPYLTKRLFLTEQHLSVTSRHGLLLLSLVVEMETRPALCQKSKDKFIRGLKVPSSPTWLLRAILSLKTDGDNPNPSPGRVQHSLGRRLMQTKPIPPAQGLGGPAWVRVHPMFLECPQ